MVPAANLIGFAGQELARKLPKVSGILIETALGGVVEILLFMILLAKHKVGEESAEEGNLVPVIQAAILGSILTNLLLCLGLCFVVGGIRHVEQRFHASISEVGTGLLLVAGFGLLIPSAFYSALKSQVVKGKAGDILSKAHKYTQERLDHDIMRISQVTSILLILAFVMYDYTTPSASRSHYSRNKQIYLLQCPHQPLHLRHSPRARRNGRCRSRAGYAQAQVDVHGMCCRSGDCPRTGHVVGIVPRGADRRGSALGSARPVSRSHSSPTR